MPVEFIGMIDTNDGSETRPQTSTAARPRLHPPLRPGARGRRLRPDPHRLRLRLAGRHPGRRVRRGAHRAAQPADRAPARLRRSPPWRPVSSPRWTSSPAAGWRCTSSPAATTRSSAATATTWARTSGTRAPTSTWGSCGGPGPGRGVQPTRARSTASRTTTPRCGRPQPDPAVLRRLLRRGLPGRRQARRHLRAVGRAAEGDRRADRLGPGRGRRGGPPRARDQRVVPADPGRDRGAGLGTGAPHPGDHRERPGPRRPSTGAGAAPNGQPENVGSQRLLAAAAKATCTTGRCGPPRPRPPAPAATPPPWSARRRRSRRRCSTTWTSA